jgi:hypothetical protein
LRVTTRCRSVADLIAAFAPVVDEESIVVVSDRERSVGARQPFVMELADGTAAMRGEVEVVAATPPPQCRVRLRFLALDSAGRDIHQSMLDRSAGRVQQILSPGESGRLPLVRIPDPNQKTTPADLLARVELGAIPKIPPLPPRLRSTSKMKPDDAVPPPPPLPEGVPPPIDEAAAAEWEDDGATDQSDNPLAAAAAELDTGKGTQKMYGLAPPPSMAPLFKVVSSGPAAEREEHHTQKMEPLFAEEWPAAAEHAVADERATYLEEKDRETQRMQELSADRRRWLVVAVVGALVVLGVLIGLALS